MANVAANVDTIECFLRGKLPHLPITRIHEADEKRLGPSARSFGLDAPNGERLWLITCSNGFVRDLHSTPYRLDLEEAVKLVRQNPGGCHVGVQPSRVGKLRSRFAEYLVRKHIAPAGLRTHP